MRIGWGLALAVCLALPAHAAVVINEVMYHPGSDKRGDEYIELFNTSTTQSVAIAGWQIREGIDFVFPPGATLPPLGFVVISADFVQFEDTYGFLPDYTFNTTAFDDAGETIRLADNFGTTVDVVTYGDRHPWPTTPDGEGPSMELIVPTLDNDHPRNWHASTHPNQCTPKAPNSVLDTALPPWIDAITHTVEPDPGFDVEVAATILDATSATLHYVIGPNQPLVEQSIAMTNGGGGLFTADIPGQAAGTLVRYRVTATGPTGTISYPRNDDTVTYDGTMVRDPDLDSDIPVFQWFVDPIDYLQAYNDENDPVVPGHVFTDETEPCVIYYDGTLYDGVTFRARGVSSRSWPKKNWRFDFPQGHNFTAPGLIPREVDSFNLQGSYADKTYMRELLAWESFRDAGGPWAQTFHVRLQQDGEFYGLYVYLESPDKNWMQRMDFDPQGSMYKASAMLTLEYFPEIAELHYEEETPGDGDWMDVILLTQEVNSFLPRLPFLQDQIDLPSMLNYLAVQSIIHNNDHVAANYYIYRDTHGTERWTMFPWDLDLTFGKNYTGSSALSDVLWADQDTLPGYPAFVSPSHPLFSDAFHQKVDQLYNRLIHVVHREEPVRTMYFRRLRSLMDKLLVEGRYEDRIDQLAAEIDDEAALDAAQAWGQSGSPQTLQQAITALKADYLDKRRVHLFETHSACVEEIPPPQTPAPRIVINEIMYAPVDGLSPDDGPLHEFVELHNPSTTVAVDVSGWRLDGVALTIPAGTVILPDGYMLFVRDDKQFRQFYGGSKFIGGEYAGSLKNTGETLTLFNEFGGVISSVTYDDIAPWPANTFQTGYSLELIDPDHDSGIL